MLGTIILHARDSPNSILDPIRLRQKEITLICHPAHNGRARGDEENVLAGTIAAIDPDSAANIMLTRTKGTDTINLDGSFDRLPRENLVSPLENRGVQAISGAPAIYEEMFHISRRS